MGLDEFSPGGVTAPRDEDVPRFFAAVALPCPIPKSSKPSVSPARPSLIYCPQHADSLIFSDIHHVELERDGLLVSRPGLGIYHDRPRHRRFADAGFDLAADHKLLEAERREWQAFWEEVAELETWAGTSK